MRKRILLVSLSVTIIGILLFTLLISDIFYRDIVRQANEQLKIYAGFFDPEELAFDEPSALAFSQRLGGARVTFMDAQATILADSFGDLSEQSRDDREEVVSALLDGEGFAVRRSATVGQSMMYYCVRLSQPVNVGGALAENCLLRIGIESSSQTGVFIDALPTMAWFLLLDILCCLIFAWIATNAVLRPVELLTKEVALSGGRPVSSRYAELQPLVKMMNDMTAEIAEKVAHVEEERRMEKLILDSMEHGIVIFRDPNDVILINKTASTLLGCDPNEPIDLFASDREIADILTAGEAASVYRKIEGRDYNFRFTFRPDSCVLLITDVTESMAAMRSKNDFIANVTHEMNTPLTSIKGFAELIETGAAPPERVQGMARTIIKQSDRLANLIRSIINFSAIDSDELPDYEVNVSELIAELIGSFEPKLRKKNIALQMDIEQGVVVLSRRERLVEILNNLITNGIRYNKDGGRLEISLTGGARPELTVRDTGIGLSEEDKERIFDRFYTVDKSHNGGGGGFGLGLAIVKKLCRRAGWELSVESTLGEGTAFSIRFCPKPEK